jgi:serpin B
MNVSRVLCAALVAGSATISGIAAVEAGDAPFFTKDEAVAELAKASNHFGLDLYGELTQGRGNLCFSPESIATALAMTYEGAGLGSQNAKEMASVLHLPFVIGDRMGDGVSTADAYREFLGRQRASSRAGFELSVANAIWGPKKNFLESYANTVKQAFGAGAREVDFNDPEAARATINGWVSDETRHKIPEIIAKGQLSKLTKLVLTNAIYLKADWTHKFEKNSTDPSPWTLASGEKVQVPTMHARFFEDVNMGSLEDADVLELPYGERSAAGSPASLVVVLPKRADGLAALEKTLTSARLDAIMASLKPADRIRVALPKWKTETSCELKAILSKLGMPNAFVASNGPDGPDFSRISSETLNIDEVIHKTFVSVDEEGTEAAAATAICMDLAAPAPARENVFIADHPFVYFVRDRATGSILFLGRMVDPRE